MRKLLFLGGFLLILGIVAYVTVRTGGSRTPTLQGVFSSDALGVSFRYKEGTDGYVARMAPSSEQYPEEYVGAVVVLRSADAENDIEQGDGPPAMTITVFENPESKTAESWARTEPWANAVSEEVLVPVNYGGVRGVRYASDGLYRADSIVLTKGSKVYHLVGMFDDQASVMRTDFADLLGTLSLR